MNQQKMKAITLNEVYMMVRLYGDTTVEELLSAEGFYVRDEEPEEEQPKKTEKRGGVMKPADHGAIVALYTANPPRTIKWIADDLGITTQTVINHLKKEGLYDPGRKEET